jgi:hypothetical protein
MKTQKYVLIALCLGVCLWSARMGFGVVGLARVQEWSALTGLLEIAAFGGAGFSPLLLLWRPEAKYRSSLVAAWALCIGYVGLLALNLLRLGYFAPAGLRLALWATIAVLAIRTVRLTPKSAQP